MVLPKSSRARKRHVVTGRIESYHRGYLVGYRCGNQQTKGKETKGKPRKVKSSRVCKKKAVEARLDAYQRGYQLGTRSGAQQEHAQHQEEKRRYLKDQKGRSISRGKEWGKRLEAARQEAYVRGLRCATRRMQAKEPTRRTPSATSARVPAPCEVQQASKRKARSRSVSVPKSSTCARASDGDAELVCEQLQTSTHSSSPRQLYAPSRRVQVPAATAKLSSKVVRAPANPIFESPSPMQATSKWQPDAHSAPLGGPCIASGWTSSSEENADTATIIEKLSSKAVRALPPAFLMAATPMRVRSGAVQNGQTSRQIGGESVVSKRASGQPHCEQTHTKLIGRGAKCSDLDEVPAATPAHMSSRAVVGSAVTDSLRSFLEDPAGVTSEPAAFQLRCQQTCLDPNGPRKKVVVVVGGKCTLWKLNQIIADSFNASDHDFAYESKKGSTFLGSHLLVSRPCHSGQGKNVVVCSSTSATHMGMTSGFINDQDHSVAQLFRGKSTRYTLQCEPADEAQHVVFRSPLLSFDVTVSLDGIMLDSYDSHNLFDKARRQSNGRKPLPRIVRSSFLSTVQMEAKNVVMQGSRQGPGSLGRFDASWSAIHASSRRAQRRPLFRKDGSDFDLQDQYHHADEETDSDDEGNGNAE